MIERGEITDSIAFLKTLLEKVSSTSMKSKESEILILIQIGLIQLNQLENLPATRETIENAKSLLDELDGVTCAHGPFYRLSAAYDTIIGDHSAFYNDALRFLGCFEDKYTIDTQQNNRKKREEKNQSEPDLAQLTQMNAAELSQWAVKLCVSALLGRDVFNFGELLTQKVASERLIGQYLPSEFGYLRQLLEAFNRGQLTRIMTMESQWQALPDLAQSRKFLIGKATIMCLMEMVFKRAPHQRQNISFQEIADETLQPLDQVELLVMTALSKDLLRGRIDEVNQRVQFSWVQPRVLQLDQIEQMGARVQQWSQSVAQIKEGMHAQLSSHDIQL